MIEGLIARIKAFVMTAAAVIAVLLGAYVLGGHAARRSMEIKAEREDKKRLQHTLDVKNEIIKEVRSTDAAAVDAELAADWMRD